MEMNKASLSGHSIVTPETRVTYIKPENRVKRVTRLKSGGMEVEQASGNTFTIKKDDEVLQAFVIYSVLAEL